MTVDLIKAIHCDFPDNDINLFGVSWGSGLAANAAARIPELLHRVVVYGQVTKELFFNQEVYEKLDAAKLNRKEREYLGLLKSNHVPEPHDIMMMAKLIRKHTEGYQAKDGGKTPMGKILFGLLTSPDYSLKSFKAIVVNGTQKNRSLLQELMCLDLSSTLESITVPYFIMQGDTDIVTPTKYIRALVETAKNGSLHFCIVPNSGHMPGGNGMAYMIEKGFDFLK